jgi:D-glycero-D-manno-heptose 1,7-bisphosphate phosphatase
VTGGRPAVFLDRDGVLNEGVVVGGHTHPPARVADVVICPGVPEACARLHAAGLLLVMVTNQPDVARGTVRRETVDAINDLLASELGLDATYVCPHDDADGCACRKPAPGMLLEAARDLGIDLGRSAIVGDRWRDIEAGARAGVTTVWVRHDYDERPPDGPDHVVTALLDAVDLLTTQLDEDCVQ